MARNGTRHPLRRGLAALACIGIVAATMVAATPALAAGGGGVPGTVLRKGDHGPLVRKLQQLLHLPADGIFGPATRRGVRRFQRHHHLLADGQVGSHTWRALLEGKHQRARRPGHHRHAHDGILRLGDQNDAVGRAQRLLHIRVNRLFDRRTWRAVRGFQRHHDLLADGQVGPHTLAALLRASHSHTHARSHVRHGRHHHRHHHHSRHHRRHHVHINDGVLGLGDHNDAVGHLQRLLHIRVNRLFDRRTWRSVRRFQRRHGLLVDGEAGPQTMAALRHRRPHHARHHATRHASLGGRALRVARRYIGVPYVWGGASPRGFDCSGLVQYAYARLGVAVPRVTYSQWYAGRHVRRDQLRAGDLVFFHDRGHVGLYIGHGWFLHAPHTGSVVHVSGMAQGWYNQHYDGAVRIG